MAVKRVLLAEVLESGMTCRLWSTGVAAYKAEIVQNEEAWLSNGAYVEQTLSKLLFAVPDEYRPKARKAARAALVAFENGQQVQQPAN